MGWALSSGNQRREGEGAWFGSDVSMSHFACSGIRKLNATLRADASHRGRSRTAHMQASTGQHTGSVRSESKTHTPALPPQFLQGAVGELTIDWHLRQIHMRREEGERKETGRKQQSVRITAGSSTLCFSLPVKRSLARGGQGAEPRLCHRGRVEFSHLSTQ